MLGLGSVALLVLLALLFVAPTALASTAGSVMPWDSPLASLASNLAGRTARVLVMLAVVACGILWVFTRNEEGLKRLGQIAFGGAIAIGAATLMASLGIAGAVV
jgi:type IV secretion system protein TrbC